ncbi:uncharacterized protein [Ptychodera flava]|uniref:uncharacterized protein n=1 Tax=Ptychodera flava TaxID=63121 RepID=UPI00396A65E5
MNSERQKKGFTVIIVFLLVVCQDLETHGEALTPDDVDHIFQYIIAHEEYHHTRYDANPDDPNENEWTVGIGFILSYANQQDFEGALPGVSFEGVRRGVRSLNDAEIEDLFKIASLPKHIENIRKLVLDFDEYTLDIQTALVDSLVAKSLLCDRDDTECALTDLINDPDVVWTQVCAKYTDTDRFRNAETQDDKTRLRNNCQYFYSYGQSLNESISGYNPCSPQYELLYPYGPEFGDNTNAPNDDGSSGQVFIQTPFPFFDEDHEFLWINTNGVISFLKEVFEFVPQSFPLGNEWRLIAPFWADVDTREGGNVFWRETRDQDVLDRATRHIQQYYVGEAGFTALWVLVATWDNVTFFGTAQPSLVNTFQTVLVTNGRHSFAIFNYGDIVWTTGASGDNPGDPYTGLGGTAAQVGFNAGDGKVFYSVPGSQNSSIVDIEDTSNIMVPGRYAFRVDTADISGGDGCDAAGSLIVYPFTGSMLGGEKIFVGGPCFSPSDDIIAKFGDQESTCTYESDLQATCITPPFYEVGRVPIEISLDGGATYRFQGIWSVLSIERTTPKVTRINAENWHRLARGLEIRWEPTELDSHYVDIHLMGYQENKAFGTEPFGWQQIMNLNSQHLNDGSFIFTPQVTSEGFETNYEMGAIRISVHDEEGEGLFKFEGLWSDVHDLKWIFDAGLHQWCKDWRSRDREWTNDAAPCPCTLQQARADIGRYSPHPQCKIGSTCHYKPDAVHCVRVNTPSDNGEGRECCYGTDGELLNHEDTLGAGPSHRRHHGGVHPYKTVGTIPYLSNFHDDTRPWIRCCVYTNFRDWQCRNQFFSRRHSQDCTGYSPPQPAIMFGDPHIITLDGHQYTFNGLGEFTMLDINNGEFLLQGRMAPLESDGPATVFKAFAMKSNWSDVIHVEQNQRRMLDAYVRQEGEVEWLFVDFEENSWWDFRGLSVSRSNMTDNKMSILFNNGISIEVSAVGQAMTLTFLAPEKYKNQTRGLMGTWNDDPDDDLLTPYGDYLSANSTLKEIHQNFGLKWNITEEMSLFRYRSITGESHETRNDLTYQPIFEIPSDPNVTSRATELCGEDNLQCIFDYQVTRDEQIAVGSRHAVDSYAMSINDTKPVVTCAYLPPPPNANKTGHSYTVGSTLTFDCQHGYTSVNGSVERVCQSDGMWDGSNITCEIVHCGELETPRNGSWNITGVTFGSEAFFVCDEGFDMIGSEVRRCQADGTWDGQQPTCRLVYCENITAPLNGTDIGKDYSYSSIVSFVCDVGFNLIGSSDIRCQANGTWNSSIPNCEIMTCPSLTIPNDGSMNSNGNTYLSVAKFSCNLGYNLHGSSDRTCTADGSWDGQSVSCEVVQCPHIDEPTNGYKVGDSNVYGSEVVFSCNHGYALKGSNTIKCMAHGMWDRAPPMCELSDCPPLEPLANGSFTVRSNDTMRIITFACDEGFILNGVTEISCFNGQWDDTPPICQVVICPSLPTPNNGTADISSNEYQSVVTFSCDNGYELHGTRIRTCTADGSWDGQPAMCMKVVCPTLETPNDGTMNSTGNTYQSVATFSCNVGYNLHGSSVRTCTADGSWDGQSVSCTVTECPFLETPNDGSMNSTGNVYQSVARFLCNDGYNLHGSSVRTCTADGSWDGQSVSCEVVTCPTLLAPNDGTMNSTGNTYLSVATFSCNDGYNLHGSSVRTCTADGSWDGQSTLCEVRPQKGPKGTADDDALQRIPAAIIGGSVAGAFLAILIAAIIFLVMIRVCRRSTGRFRQHESKQSRPFRMNHESFPKMVRRWSRDHDHRPGEDFTVTRNTYRQAYQH